MDGTRGRFAAALTAASCCALGLAGTAQAAQFTTQPPLYVKPAAQTYAWMIAPDTPGAQVAWKLSTETAWHRCATDPTVTLTSPAEGRYTLEAQDETQLCSESDTSAPGRNVTWRRSTIVVDGTPPVLGVPIVSPAIASAAWSRPTVMVEVAATDALSGVDTLTWNAGDGS